MVSRIYNPLVALAAMLGSFLTAVEVARHLAGYPGTLLAVPGVTFAFMLSRRVGGEPWPEKLASATAFSVLAGASVWIGMEMAAHPVLGGVAFVVLMSGSVWARRFGPVVTRLGALVPLALIACLLSSKSGSVSEPWWPICGWYALAGFSAFVWTRALRWAGGKLTGIPGPPSRPVSARPTDRRTGLSVHTRMALQMAGALTLAFWLGRVLFGQHWQWTVISAMTVNLGTVGRGDVAWKGIERGLGAMGGTLIGTGIALADPHGVVSVIAIFAVLTLALGLRPLNYACFAAGITTALSLLYGYFGESAQHLLLTRLQALALGATVAVAVGWFLVPVRASDALRIRMAAMLAALSTFLQARRDAASAGPALAGFDAAADALSTSLRPHRLYRPTARKLRTARGVLPADACDALLAVRGPVHALAATKFSPHERATATTVGLARKALATRSGPVPEPSEAADEPPLSELDTALRQFIAAIPALARPPAQAPKGTGALRSGVCLGWRSCQVSCPAACQPIRVSIRPRSSASSMRSTNCPTPRCTA